MDETSKDIFVIAEAGVNHNGSVEMAHRLIDVSADLGADAVKFQTFDPSLLVAAGTSTVTYQESSTGLTDQHEMLSDLALPIEAWRELADHARDVAVEFMSTAFDAGSLELLIDLGVRRLKVPSGELTNLPFVRSVAEGALPVIISTGMGTMQEVIDAADAAAQAPSVTLLHCVSAYPAPLADANMRAIQTMREATALDVGWSDHCNGTEAVALAVALGAVMVERHLTLDCGLQGPDHAASDDPEQFAAYIEVIRSTRSALGNGKKEPAASEDEARQLARRSWHVTRDLRAGHVLTADDTIALRPATGISPAHDVLGAVLATAVQAGQPLTYEVLDSGNT